MTRARTLTLSALVAGVAALAVVFFNNGTVTPTHRVFLQVPNATNVIKGQEVRAAGQKVGSIGSLEAVDKGRAVRIGLDIDDEAWPLTKGAKATFRWGGTIAYVNRYIALERGPQDAPKLRDGATLPPTDTFVPLELDEFLATFTPKTRRDLGLLVKNGGPAFDRARPAFRDAFISTPPALEQTSAVLADLTADKQALDTLVRSTSSVVDAVQRADPGIGPLISGASRTFRAVATRTRALQTGLDLSATTLASTERTLRRARGTLVAAGDVASRVAPGVTELRRLARPLNRTLATVTQVAPDARGTLRTARTSTPELTGLLDRATRELPRIASLSRQAATSMSCIRPYSPEIAGFFSVWADFLSYTDGKDKILRAQVQSFLPTTTGNTSNQTSAQAKSDFPGLEYGYPRPPGALAAQPWLLPECKAGLDALDPAKDPESRNPSEYPMPKLGRMPAAAGNR